MGNLGNPQSIDSCHFINLDLAANLADTTLKYFQKTWDTPNQLKSQLIKSVPNSQ